MFQKLYIFLFNLPLDFFRITASCKWCMSLWHYRESNVSTSTLSSLNGTRDKHVTLIKAKCAAKCIQLSSLFTLSPVFTKISDPKKNCTGRLVTFFHKLSLTPTVDLSMLHWSNIFGHNDLFAAIDFSSDGD